MPPAFVHSLRTSVESVCHLSTKFLRPEQVCQRLHLRNHSLAGVARGGCLGRTHSAFSSFCNINCHSLRDSKKFDGAKIKDIPTGT
jgi:hypothetical protein